MNFFKSAKYKMGGSSKEKKSEKSKEHFHKTDPPPSYSLQSKDESKSPEKVSKCFRLRNNTSFPWKLQSAGETIFPSEVAPQDSKLVKLENQDGSIEGIYLIDVTRDDETKSFEFKFKVSRDGNNHKLTIDWQDLASMDGIKFKPDSTGSEQPINLTSNEITIELEMTS
ncbi:uncharacterized protein LOC143449525 [Clavelina lepadiformis]|uniref:uncharacterized protein LOC143449525 n=1 Tax=Clavelina lepadiformis TaxID=159417 RepID=UPI004041B88D